MKPFGVASRDGDSSFMALLPPAVGTFEVGILSCVDSIVVVGSAATAVELRSAVGLVVGLGCDAALALFFASICKASTRVSPEARALWLFAELLPLRLYILESAAENVRFHSSGVAPGGAGAASLYLNLNYGLISM